MNEMKAVLTEVEFDYPPDWVVNRHAYTRQKLIDKLYETFGDKNKHHIKSIFRMFNILYNQHIKSYNLYINHIDIVCIIKYIYHHYYINEPAEGDINNVRSLTNCEYYNMIVGCDAEAKYDWATNIHIQNEEAKNNPLRLNYIEEIKYSAHLERLDCDWDEKDWTAADFVGED
jgi:hypothetical protein